MIGKEEAKEELKRLAKAYEITTVFTVLIRSFPMPDGSRTFVVKALAIDAKGLVAGSAQAPCIWLTRHMIAAGLCEGDNEGLRVSDPYHVAQEFSTLVYGDYRVVRHEAL